LYEKYADVFKSLQERSDQLSQRLTELGDAIEAESTQYNRDVSQFNSDVAAFNQRAESGGFSSQAEFNSQRAALLARGDALEASRQQINDKVTEYERLRAELIGIASQSEALNRSIDSSLAPAPSL
jgi:predicted  nucleic acid-binding Zn-ribbon protein